MIIYSMVGTVAPELVTGVRSIQGCGKIKGVQIWYIEISAFAYTHVVQSYTQREEGVDSIYSFCLYTCGSIIHREGGGC